MYLAQERRNIFNMYLVLPVADFEEKFFFHWRATDFGVGWGGG